MYITECEERELVDWAVEIGRTGYGRTREQASRIVKKLVDKMNSRICLLMTNLKGLVVPLPLPTFNVCNLYTRAPLLLHVACSA